MFTPPMHTPSAHRSHASIVSAITVFCAGIVNGLLGTGGGILLLRVLRRSTEPQNAFASALACILPMSLLSAWLYGMNGSITVSALLSRDILPFLIGAIPGGILGAVLLDRLKLSVIQSLFAMLLLFSGWRMAFC